MTYYTHYSILAALQHVYVDAPSGDSADGMTYYTYHRYVDDLHHVCVDLEYSEKKETIMTNIKRDTKLETKFLQVPTISTDLYDISESLT
jgi:hypothetical protein